MYVPNWKPCVVWLAARSAYPSYMVQLHNHFAGSRFRIVCDSGRHTHTVTFLLVGPLYCMLSATVRGHSANCLIVAYCHIVIEVARVWGNRSGEL